MAVSPKTEPPFVTTFSFRCPHCEVRVRGDAAVCSGCGNSLSVMCVCGETSHARVETCPACHATLAEARVRRPFAVKRLFAAAMLLVVVGAAGFALWNASQVRESKAEVWRMRDAAFEAGKAGEFDLALPLLQKLLVRRPRDVQMWYLRAVAEREVGLPAETYLASARRVLEIDSSFSEAAGMIGAAYLAQGDADTAHEYALQCVAGARPAASGFRLLAETEIRRSRPDVAAAIAALLRARQLGDDDPLVRISMALLELRRLENVPVDLYPPRVARLVDVAEQLLLQQESEGGSDLDMRVAAAEFALARGDFQRALPLAEKLVTDPEVSRARIWRARALMLLGRAQFRAGDVAAGLASFSAALVARPTRATAGEVAGFLTAEGQSSLAVTLLNEAIAGGAPAGEIAVPLASLELSRGRGDAAEVALSAAEDSADTDLLRGDVARLRGDIKAADAAYGRAISRAPDDMAAHLRRAQLVLARDDTSGDVRAAAKRAIESVDAARGSATRSQIPGCLETIGALQVAAERLDEAEQTLRTAVSVRPYSARASLALATLLMRPDRTGDRDEILRLAEYASAVAPHDDAVTLDAARICLSIGAPREAVAICSRLTHRHGDRPAVLKLEAEALRSLGRWQESAQRLDAAVALAPGDAGLWLAYVDSLLRQGATAAARTTVQRAAEAGVARERLDLLVAIRGGADEDDIVRLAREGPSDQLAALLLALGRVHEAIDALDDVLDGAPRDVAARRILVFALLDSEPDGGGIDRARAVIDAAPPDFPKDQRRLLDGALLLAEGEYPAAIATLAAATRARPFDPHAHFLLGQARYRSGQRIEGVRILRRAVVLPGADAAFAAALSNCLLEMAEGSEDESQRVVLLRESIQHNPNSVRATAVLVELLYRRANFSDVSSLAARIADVPGVEPADAAQFRRLALSADLQLLGLGALSQRFDEIARKQDPEWVDRVVDGLVLLRTGHAENAATVFERLLRGSRGDDGVVVVGYLESLLRGAGPERALDRLRELVGAERVPGWAQLAIAASMVRVGRPELASAVIDVLLAERPTDLAALRAGVAAELRGPDPARALGLVKRAESAAADAATRVAIRTLKASVLRSIGRFDEALTLALSLQESSLRNEPAAEVRLIVAEVLIERGDVAEGSAALSVARSAIESLGAAPLGLLARLRFAEAALSLREGRLEDAERSLTACVALNPLDHAATNNLAYLLSSRPSEARRALGLAEAATLAMPAVAEYWDTRALCERNAGKSDAAETSWREALRLYGDRSPPPVSQVVESEIALAELLASGGRFAESRALAQTVLERKPVADVVRRARDLLRPR